MMARCSLLDGYRDVLRPSRFTGRDSLLARAVIANKPPSCQPWLTQFMARESDGMATAAPRGFRAWPLPIDSAQAHRDHEEDCNNGGDNTSGGLDDDAPSGPREECHNCKCQKDVMPRHSNILNDSAGMLRCLNHATALLRLSQIGITRSFFSTFRVSQT